MEFKNTRSTFLSTVMASSLLIAGCNGGSSSSSGSGPAPTPPPQNNSTVADGVAGPLDEIQNPLSDTVFEPITSSAAGTPLQVTLDCARQAVVVDLVDVLDSIALALMQGAETQDPAAAFESASDNIQFSLGELAHDLPGALGAVTGDDCNTPDSDAGEGSDNPLAGTPLEPLGAALAPVIDQFPSSEEEPGDGGEDPDGNPPMDLTTLAVLVNQLAIAFNSGVSQIPAEAQQAPIFGGVLTTLGDGLSDLAITLYFVSIYNGDAAAGALENTLNTLLVNVLTNIVPVNYVEAEAGQEGALSGPITDGVDQLTSALGENLLAAALPQITDALGGNSASLLAPFEDTLLPSLLAPITDALPAGGDDSSSPLDLILGPLTDALSGGGSASEPTGTPLDALLGPLFDLTGNTCPFADTPLAPSCTLYDLLPI